ncbi:MAG: hypothetical protein ACP5G2_00900 [Candidatus Bipolaricaulaceae bacterium]
MTWRAYQVVLRLRSPLHIGWGKVGNLQRTRPYVTGRVLWGALTARLARDQVPPGKPATAPDLYEAMGQQVHQLLAFTYLFTTTWQDGHVDIWPWEKGFSHQFLSTYASTALIYPQQSAAEGTLHEVECISPHTPVDGRPVYLTGYIFAQEDAPEFSSTLHRLQLGGERGYGWGRVEQVKCQEWDSEQPIFGQYTFHHSRWPPVLTAVKEAKLLAHALAVDFNDDGLRRAVQHVDGPIEPLVGRETKAGGRFGEQVSHAHICYVPGSNVEPGSTFQIGPYGIWEAP